MARKDIFLRAYAVFYALNLLVSAASILALRACVPGTHARFAPVASMWYVVPLILGFFLFRAIVRRLIVCTLPQVSGGADTECHGHPPLPVTLYLAAYIAYELWTFLLVFLSFIVLSVCGRTVLRILSVDWRAPVALSVGARNIGYLVVGFFFFRMAVRRMILPKICGDSSGQGDTGPDIAHDS